MIDLGLWVKSLNYKFNCSTFTYRLTVKLDLPWKKLENIKYSTKMLYRCISELVYLGS